MRLEFYEIPAVIISTRQTKLFAYHCLDQVDIIIIIVIIIRWTSLLREIQKKNL